ncbi:hypothetical protein STEG23_031435, partial [Scotinomys teguina]
YLLPHLIKTLVMLKLILTMMLVTAPESNYNRVSQQASDRIISGFLHVTVTKHEKQECTQYGSSPTVDTGDPGWTRCSD